MSETTLCLVFSKSARWLRDYDNSHGSFPAVMAYLLREEEQEFHNSKFGMRESQKLDAARKNIFSTIFKSSDIPIHIKACYAVCLDGAIIARAHQKELSRLLIEGGDVIEKALPEHICHFTEIGRDVQKERIPKNALGIALDITSVQNTWLYGAWPNSEVKPFCVGSSLGLRGE